MPHQVDEDQAADQVRPYVDGLVVYHEETASQLGVAIEINSISSHDVIIVQHVFLSILVRSDVVGLFNLSCFLTLFQFLSCEKLFVFQLSRTWLS